MFNRNSQKWLPKKSLEGHLSLMATHKTKLLASTALMACSLAASFAIAADKKPSQPPNILLIISDDVGLDATTNMIPGLVDQVAKQYGPKGHNHPKYQSIQGHPAVTPNLDRIAKQGITFSNVWAQPFCSPTRASILTGLFAAKVNVINYTDPLSQHHTSFVRQLKEQGGYSTGVFGKWHMAGMPGKDKSYPGMKPKEAGFDIFKGNMHAAIKTYWDYEYMTQDAATAANEWRTENAPTKSLPGITPTTYSGVVQVADALEWIQAQQTNQPNKPWFTWLAFNLAHATAQQNPSAMMVPNIDTLSPEAIAEMKACNGTFGTNTTDTCSGESLMRAMTNSMDVLIGKLIDQVDKIAPNTIVIYVADNGTPMYGRPNLDFIDNLYITRKGRGKGTTYESGARVPIAIRGPGIKPQRVSNDFTHVADLFPTILSLAGLYAPSTVSNGDGSGIEKLDGVSLVPIVNGKAKTVRDPNQGYLLTESLNLMTNSTRQVAARNATFKVICTEKVENGACEFYNLAKDPLEEYPLDKPATCDSNASTSNPQWHYCRLANLIRTESFFAKGR
jgi:arylsulfatase A-like enzyme